MKRLVAVLFSIVLILSLVSCGGGSDESSDSSEAHLYDRAVVENVLSGSGDPLDTKYAYIEAKTSEVDLDALADVYFNYFKDSDINHLFIIYTDNEPHGVYMMDSLVEDNIEVTKNPQGQYMESDTSECSYYVPKEDGTLELFE